jgi:hypothetical protein
MDDIGSKTDLGNDDRTRKLEAIINEQSELFKHDQYRW